MTTPNAQAIESATNFTGTQRQWVKAVAREAARAAVAEVREELLTAIDRSADNARFDQELLRRIKAVEERYAEDDKYTLTPAKLKSLMKNLGIE